MAKKKFDVLFRKMSPEAQARVEARARAQYEGLPLAELREAQELTQTELAKRLRVDQAAISKLEHRTDMLLSTLGEVIRGMGGELQINACFPSGTVYGVTVGREKSTTAGTAAKRR